MSFLNLNEKAAQAECVMIYQKMFEELKTGKLPACLEPYIIPYSFDDHSSQIEEFIGSICSKRSVSKPLGILPFKTEGNTTSV